MPVSGVSERGRATQGVHLIRLEEGDEVAAVAQVARDVELPDGGAGVVAEGADEGELDDSESTGDDAGEADGASDEV